MVPERIDRRFAIASFCGSTASNFGGDHSTGTSGVGIWPAAHAASVNQRQTGAQNIGMNSCHCTASICRRNSTSPARIEE